MSRVPAFAPAPSWFIFNSLTLYFNVIALPPATRRLPSAPACHSRYFLGKARQRRQRQRQLGPVLRSGMCSFLGCFVFCLHIYIFDGCGCQVYFPGYIFLSLFILHSPLLLYIRHFAISISRTENCLHCAEASSSGNRSSPANCSFKSVSEGCNKCSNSNPSKSNRSERFCTKGA